MVRIRVPVKAYILSLVPKSLDLRAGGGSRFVPGGYPISNGLAIPSFWTRAEITQAFADANRIWVREAEIEFGPVDISERAAAVPADDQGMWIEFVNQLSPKSGIAVAFVYELPSGDGADEGGWGGGRIAAVSGTAVESPLPGFAGNLLAHELGHALVDDPNHLLAGGDPRNLMHGVRDRHSLNKGLLNQRQIDAARNTATRI